MRDTLSVHHINFLVKDLDTTCEYLSKVLSQDAIRESLPLRNVNTARFQLNNCWLVLVQPLSEQGEVARILAHRGEGLFLLSLGCDDLDKQISRLEKQDICVNAKSKRKGLSDWSVVDLEHPSGLGPVLQLCALINPTSSNS
ncbi:MAG: hypothetical protein Alis3KO_30770 [Aliiglaciecola sp.]